MLFIGGGCHADATTQKLREMVIAFIGTHFHKSCLGNTILPLMHSFCGEEDIVSIAAGLDALLFLLRVMFGIGLVDCIEAWFWDGPQRQHQFSNLGSRPLVDTYASNIQRNAQRPNSRAVSNMRSRVFKKCLHSHLHPSTTTDPSG